MTQSPTASSIVKQESAIAAPVLRRAGSAMMCAAGSAGRISAVFAAYASVVET